MLFCEYIFSKEHPIRFRGFVIIEKQCVIVRIFGSSHSQMLKNFGELYKIRHLENSAVLPQNIPEIKSSALQTFIFSIFHFSCLQTECITKSLEFQEVYLSEPVLQTALVVINDLRNNDMRRKIDK